MLGIQWAEAWLQLSSPEPQDGALWPGTTRQHHQWVSAETEAPWSSEMAYLLCVLLAYLALV